MWVRKGWNRDMEALLVWQDIVVSEQRCPFVGAHPQEMLVTHWSIFRRVKMVWSFRKSRVLSRTRFQFKVLPCPSSHGTYQHGEDCFSIL